MTQLPSKQPPKMEVPVAKARAAVEDAFRNGTERFKWKVGMAMQVACGLAVLSILVALTWVGSALADDILDGFSRTAADRFLGSSFASWLGGYVGSLVKLIALGGALAVAWLVTLRLAVDSTVDRRRFGRGGLLGIWGILAAQALVTELVRQLGGAASVAGIQELIPIFVPAVIALLAGVAYVVFRTKIVPLAWREIKVLLLNPMGYGLMAVMLLVMAKVIADAMGSLQTLDPYSETAIAPLRLVFDHWGIPIVFLLLGPLATMGLISDERTRGTFEGLMSLPAREWHIAVGKFLGCFAAVAILWTTVLFYMFFLGIFGTLDGGQVLTSFLVVYLLLMMLVSVGLFCSTLARTQLAAAVMSVVLVAAMMWATELPSFFGQITGGAALVGGGLDTGGLSYFDGQTHLTWAARGTIDSRTIAYLLSMTLLFLFLSVHALKASRTGSLDLRRYSPHVVKIVLLVFWVLLAIASVCMLIWAIAWLFTDAPEALTANRDLYFVGMLLLAVGNVAAFFMGAPRLLTTRRRVSPLAAAGFGVVFVGSVALALLAVTGALGLTLVMALQPAVLVGGIAMIWLTPCDSEGRRIRWSANIVTGALAILMIAVGFNFLSYWHHSHVDLSKGHAFSLPPEAKKVFNETVQRGEVVEVLSLISHVPPKAGATLSAIQSQDNARYEILKLYLDNLDKAINRPGNVKFVYKFLAEGSTDYQDARNNFPIRGNQDLILKYRGRSTIIPDGALFGLAFNDEAIEKYLAELRRQKQRREISGDIPTLQKIKESAKPENLPPEYQTIRPQVDADNRVVIEKRILESAIRLVKNAFTNVYVTGDHGELRLVRGQGGEGGRTAFTAATALEQAGINVQPLPRLRPEEPIDPATCDVLVVAGPTKKMPAELVAKIAAYLKAGGSVMLMFDPIEGADAADAVADPAAPFAELLAECGVVHEPWMTYTCPAGPSRIKQLRRQIPMMMRQDPSALRGLRQNIRGDFNTGLWWGVHSPMNQLNPLPATAKKSFPVYNTHPITRPLWNQLFGASREGVMQLVLVFDGVRYAAPARLDPGNAPRYRVTPLLWTPGEVDAPPIDPRMRRRPPQFSMSVWTESKAGGPVPVPLPDAGERRGPFPFAVIAERIDSPEAGSAGTMLRVTPGGAKLLVVGDSGFISDAVSNRYEAPKPGINVGANEMLWTSMISYLAGPPKTVVQVKARELMRYDPKPELERAPIGLLAALLVITSVLLGTMVWLIRRRA